jgi:hypothetical protein
MAAVTTSTRELDSFLMPKSITICCPGAMRVLLTAMIEIVKRNCDVKNKSQGVFLNK